jgi:diguanylate cyclase (GGDEF)-like protein/PAS domain S-box-containing protein
VVPARPGADHRAVHVSRIVAVVVAAVLVVATGVAAIVGFAYDARQREVARTDVRRAALRSLTAELDTLVVSTRQVSALFGASDDVSTDEFRTFVSPMLLDGSASAYGWLPHVEDADRAAWERRTGVRIRQFGAEGVEVAPRRPTYDPMLLLQTAVPVKLQLGMDVASEADHAPALRLAQALEEPRSTPVITLKGSYVPGLLVYAPVRGRDGELTGSAVGSFRIAALTSAIGGVLPNGAAFELRQAGKRIAGRGTLDRHADSWIVDIAGQRWEVLTSAAPVGRLGNGVIALLVGGLMTAIVLLTLSSLAREAGRAERKAAGSEQRFARAFEHAPVGMALLDGAGRHVKANEAMARLLGRTREELVGLGPEHIMPAEEIVSSISLINALIRGDQPYFAGDTTLLASDGRRIRAAVHMTVLDHEPGHEAAVLVHAVDVTEQRLAERRMKHLADHDPLTGLLNRRGFGAALQNQLAHTRRYGASGALLMLDLDGFKVVNDTRGHDAGDQLLVQVAAELRTCLRETDVIARLGGDEFAVILPRETLEDATVVADKVIERLRECRLGAAGPGSPGATVSIGVAPFTSDYERGEDVLREADLAMYSAKGAGRNRRAVHGRQPGVV